MNSKQNTFITEDRETKFPQALQLTSLETLEFRVAHPVDMGVVYRTFALCHGIAAVGRFIVCVLIYHNLPSMIISKYQLKW